MAEVMMVGGQPAATAMELRAGFGGGGRIEGRLCTVAGGASKKFYDKHPHWLLQTGNMMESFS